jgi:hypothetical protein
MVALLCLYIFRWHIQVQERNDAPIGFYSPARTVPTQPVGMGSAVDHRRISELKRRWRAFVPAEDALRHLKTQSSRSSSRSLSVPSLTDVKLEDDARDDSEYRRGSWVHHEAPPYHDEDWFYFESGTASSDPWDFKHKRDHLKRGGTHKWAHTPELKISADKHGQEVYLRSFDTPELTTVSTTTSSDATLAQDPHPHRRRLAAKVDQQFKKLDAHDAEHDQDSPMSEEKDDDDKPEKDHFFSSWLRPEPIMFKSINIKPGQAPPALALIGCTVAASVGGSAMRKVPMEVPLDQSAMGWMPMKPQDQLGGAVPM